MTTKLYDLDSHCRVFSAQVLACAPAEGGKWYITLDQTAFFPEGGGQPADQGTLGSVQVLDVRRRETPSSTSPTGPSPPARPSPEPWTGTSGSAGCSATPGST